jgi:hypothetical protein
MLLCDHIIFWTQHRQRPVLRIDTFDYQLFLLAVQVSIVQIEIIQRLLKDAMIKFVADIREVIDKEGKAGAHRWIDSLWKKK